MQTTFRVSPKTPFDVINDMAGFIPSVCKRGNADIPDGELGYFLGVRVVYHILGVVFQSSSILSLAIYTHMQEALEAA